MMQACQNGRGRPRIIRRNAERPRTITRGSIHAREYHLICRRPPCRARHRRRSQLPDSLPLPGLGNSRTNRDLLVQLRVNN